MRSVLNQDDFFKKMKKKPPLQKILDTLDDYTSEELENIHGQPLWIRQQLVKLKKNDGKDPSVTAEQLADMMIAANKPSGPIISPTYEVRQWLGADWQMSCGVTGALKIEVTSYDCLIIYDVIARKVGLSSSIGFLNNQEWKIFLRDTMVIGQMTRAEFSNYVSQQLTRKHGSNISPTAAGMKAEEELDPNVIDRGLFKIIRHDKE